MTQWFQYGLVQKNSIRLLKIKERERNIKKNHSLTFLAFLGNEYTISLVSCIKIIITSNILNDEIKK